MRKWLWILLLVGGAGAEEDAPLPEKARLGRGAPRYVVGRAYALPEGVAAAEKPASMKARLEKDDYFFFDVDGNGKFNDLGVDGWALNRMPIMLPLEETTVIGASRWTWRVEEEFVHYRRDPLPLSEGQRQVLIQFNQWRLMNGLPAVTIDEDLCDACAKHCAYMEKHGMTHLQEEGRDGYTREGADAGRRSCLGEDGPVQSVHMFYASFYHRLPLMHPGTRAIGVGASSRFAAVDGLTRKDRRAWTWPVIVPAPNSFGHPTHFSPEAPNPLPPEIEWAGFPITLTFEGGKITDARAELRLKSEKGKEVPVLVSSPEHPANKDRPDNRMSICVIPRVPLAPLKTWWVRVRWSLDGEPQERTWKFNTGPRGPGPVVRAWAAHR